MAGPYIDTAYGNRHPTPIRNYYPQLMDWVQNQGGPSSWGDNQSGKIGIHPPNMYDAGIGQGSEEEDMILKLIYAALGTPGQQSFYEANRVKRGTKRVAADEEAGNITDLPAR